MVMLSMVVSRNGQLGPNAKTTVVERPSVPVKGIALTHLPQMVEPIAKEKGFNSKYARLHRVLLNQALHHLIVNMVPTITLATMTVLTRPRVRNQKQRKHAIGHTTNLFAE